MVKNGKTTLEKLEGLVGVVARNVADIKDKMATKDDIKGLEFKMEDTERRLSTKIDAVDEKLDALEEVDSDEFLFWKKM